MKGRPALAPCWGRRGSPLSSAAASGVPPRHLEQRASPGQVCIGPLTEGSGFEHFLGLNKSSQCSRLLVSLCLLAVHPVAYRHPLLQPGPQETTTSASLKLSLQVGEERKAGQWFSQETKVKNLSHGLFLNH